MRSISMILFTVGLLTLWPTKARCSDTSCHILVPRENVAYLFRVWANGKAESLPYSFVRQEYGTMGLGNSGPALSPDNGWIAYIKDHDLWLLDLASKEETRITQIREESKGRTGYSSYISQWSPEGGRLLYCVVPDWNAERTPMEACPEAGFHIYDLGTGTSRAVEIQGVFQCWLRGDEVVVIGESGQNFADQSIQIGIGDLNLYEFSKSEFTILMEEPDLPTRALHFYQLCPNAQGTRLALGKVLDEQLGLLGELDVGTGEFQPLTEAGSLARFQWPQFSPGGQGISYIGSDEDRVIYVNGLEIFRTAERMGPDAVAWVSDEVVAIAAGDSLRLFDVRTGRQRGASVPIPENLD